MTVEEDDVHLLVEFKLWLVRTVEDQLLRELTASAKAQGRRLPEVTRTLVRSGATAAVSELGPSDLGRFADGDSWGEALRSAVSSGAWGRLLDETVRHAFAPDVA